LTTDPWVTADAGTPEAMSSAPVAMTDISVAAATLWILNELSLRSVMRETSMAAPSSDGTAPRAI
jgi:hypothetical protein